MQVDEQRADALPPELVDDARVHERLVAALDERAQQLRARAAHARDAEPRVAAALRELLAEHAPAHVDRARLDREAVLVGGARALHGLDEELERLVHVLELVVAQAAQARLLVGRHPVVEQLGDGRDEVDAPAVERLLAQQLLHRPAVALGPQPEELDHAEVQLERLLVAARGRQPLARAQLCAIARSIVCTISRACRKKRSLGVLFIMRPP